MTSLSLALCGPAFAQKESDATTEVKKMTADKTIVELAMGSEDCSTLVTAIQAAGLAETLSGEGPFTVFAPTNEAFEALPEGALEDLLKPENKEKLASILKYHVLPGKVMAADVKPMMAETVEGSKVTVKVDDGTVMIDKAKVIATDIEASNGVIHKIDAVLMPSEGNSDAVDGTAVPETK